MSSMVPAPLTAGAVAVNDNDIHKGTAIKTSLGGKILTHALLIVGVLLSIFPFYWLFVMATRTTDEIFSYPPKFLPGDQFLVNLRSVVTNVDLPGALFNTVWVSVLSVLLIVFFDSLAAFAFAKYDFPGKNKLFVLMLATMLIPGSLSLVPSFVLVSRLGWVGGFESLIIPGAANAFGIFLLRQMAQGSIPDELVESARIDGAGFFKIYWSIALPMLRGGIAFLAIFSFIGSWNDYVWPLIVLVDPKKQTLQTALSTLNSVYGTDYGAVMAGAFVSVLPLVVLFIIGSRHFIANIAAGALKG